MNVKEMNLDAMIEHGFLVKVSAIKEVEGVVYALVTDETGSEQLYQYVPEPKKHEKHSVTIR